MNEKEESVVNCGDGFVKYSPPLIFEVGQLFSDEEKRRLAEPLYKPIRAILGVTQYDSNGTERLIAAAFVDVVAEMMRQLESKRYSR